MANDRRPAGVRHPGRHRSESPAGFNRKRWPTSIGMPGRLQRNPHSAVPAISMELGRSDRPASSRPTSSSSNCWARRSTGSASVPANSPVRSSSISLCRTIPRSRPTPIGCTNSNASSATRATSSRASAQSSSCWLGRCQISSGAALLMRLPPTQSVRLSERL